MEEIARQPGERHEREQIARRDQRDEPPADLVGGPAEQVWKLDVDQPHADQRRDVCDRDADPAEALRVGVAHGSVDFAAEHAVAKDLHEHCFAKRPHAPDPLAMTPGNARLAGLDEIEQQSALGTALAGQPAQRIAAVRADEIVGVRAARRTRVHKFGHTCSIPRDRRGVSESAYRRTK